MTALILRANIAMLRNDPTSAIVDFRAVLHQPTEVLAPAALPGARVHRERPAGVG